MFEVKITNTDGAAFKSEVDDGASDAYTTLTEIIRILNKVQSQLKQDAMALRTKDSGKCMDYNGNCVGEWRYSI